MKTTIGDCEFCSTVNVALILQHGDMMCQGCIDKENAVITKHGEINQILAASQKIDASLEIDTDVMTAETVALVELRAAIEHDENIPAESKEYAYAKAAKDHIIHLRDLNSTARKEIAARENRILIWQKNVREVALRLDAKHRAELELQDSSYKPATFKKPSKVAQQPGKVTKRFNKKALMEAAAKYGVPMLRIQDIFVKKPGITVDEAARRYCDMMDIDITHIK